METRNGIDAEMFKSLVAIHRLHGKTSGLVFKQKYQNGTGLPEKLFAVVRSSGYGNADSKKFSGHIEKRNL